MNDRLIARWECRPDARGRMRPVLTWGASRPTLAPPVTVGARIREERVDRPSVVAAA